MPDETTHEKQEHVLIDEVLMKEDMVYQALVHAVEENAISPEEAEERLRAYHKSLIVPDIAGRDL